MFNFSINAMDPKSRKILQLLRLRQVKISLFFIWSLNELLPAVERVLDVLLSILLFI